MSKVITSKFCCLGCGHEMVLPRKSSRIREKGHFKKIYCIGCKEEVNHLEVRPFDMDFSKEEFMKDLELGKFKHLLLEEECG